LYYFVYVQFFLTFTSYRFFSLPEKYFDRNDSSRETAMLRCKITLPDSPHPILLLVKIRDFGHFVSPDGMNSVSFNKYQKNFILAAGFCPKNLAFARKIMALPESGGLQPPAP